MKKVTRILGLASMAALLVFSACKKKETTSSFNLSIPPMTVNTVDGERAYIDEDWLFTWSGNDEVCVYNLSDQYDESTMQIFHNVTGFGPVATFQGPDVGTPKFYKYFYFYPTTMVSCDVDELATENRQTFNVPPTQNFQAYWTETHEIAMVDATSMPMAINTDNIHQNSRLNHMFGIATISLKAKRNQDIVVNSIVLTANEMNLWGTADLRLHAVDTNMLWQVWNEYVDADPNFATDYDTYIIQTLGWHSNNDGGNSITLNCIHPDEDGETMIGTQLANNAKDYTDFNFMLRPLALSKGFTVDIYFDPEHCPSTGDHYQITSWNHEDLEFSIIPAKFNVWRYNQGFQN